MNIKNNLSDSIKIVTTIKKLLCPIDCDYDNPIISPKFLSDILDQMLLDGFELPDDNLMDTENDE